MKMYKKRFYEYFKKVLNYRGYSVFDIKHSVERYNERVGKPIFLYEKLLKKGINYLIDKGLESTEDRYIWYSKKYGFGIQVEWRTDNTGRQRGYNGWTATTLSEDEMNFFTKKDKKIMLEKVYTRIEFPKELERELSLCNLYSFTEDYKWYNTFELIEL